VSKHGPRSVDPHIAVHLAAPDPDASSAFYVEHLGFHRSVDLAMADGGRKVVLVREGLRLYLTAGPAPVPTGLSLAVAVDDAEATIAAMRAAGVDARLVQSPPYATFGEARDPAGHLWGLVTWFVDE